MKFELMLWYCMFWFLYMWWLVCVCVCVYYAMQYVIIMHCFFKSYPLSVLWLPGKGSGVLDLVSAHFPAKLSLKNAVEMVSTLRFAFKRVTFTWGDSTYLQSHHAGAMTLGAKGWLNSSKYPQSLRSRIWFEGVWSGSRKSGCLI